MERAEALNLRRQQRGEMLARVYRSVTAQPEDADLRELLVDLVTDVLHYAGTQSHVLVARGVEGPQTITDTALDHYVEEALGR